MQGAPAVSENRSVAALKMDEIQHAMMGTSRYTR